MPTPTICRLGSWNPLLDSFGPHPANPNNAIVDLNDNLYFSLVDDQEGRGRGLDWGTPQATLATSNNMRVTGERITKRVYNTNRQIVAKLYWGPAATYLWIYYDSLLAGRNTRYDTPAAQYSLESNSLPVPTHSAGGPGTQQSGTINLNQTGNTALQLDPTLGETREQGGVNQLLGVLTDQNGAVLPLVAQVRYTPTFLYPP